MIRQRIVVATATGLTAALTLAACGSSKDGSASPAPAGAGATSGSSGGSGTSGMNMGGSASGPSTGGADAMPTTNMLMVSKSKLGQIVTDHKGYTLYRYAKDMKGMSMCAGACAKKWLAVMPDGKLKGVGVKAALVGTIKRSDGMKQVTLGGWPLYRYTGDTAPGQSNGQGMSGAWAAATPAGAMAMNGMKM